MQGSQVRERVERFASLQAAYRALARSVHPAELATIREKSRNLLIALQALSSKRNESPTEAAETSVASIDGALDEQTERTLAILAGIELSQMRATIPMLSARYPDEVAGLVDVLLSGPIEDDKNLRTLEYLITMLSAEERGGRRVIVREAGQVTPQLREWSRRASSDPDGDWVAAERVLETAATKVLQEGEIGETRDRMRHYKRQLGKEILHPRILAATVAYNVAMWNRVAAEIDSSRAMEQLAEELFDQHPIDQPHEASLVPDTGSEDILSGNAFSQLVEAFGARLSGETSGEGPFSRLAAALPANMLRTEDAEAFEGDREDGSTWLMRCAVVLGLILKERSRIGDALASAGISLEQLETQSLRKLILKMSERARKLFAASDYAEAFRLSDVKTHNLTPYANAHTEQGPNATNGQIGETLSDDANSAPTFSGLLGALARSLRPGPVLSLGLIVLTLGFLFMGSSRSGNPERVALKISSISPFLESGAESGSGTMRSFNGRVNAAWDYLGTPERREVVEEIGRYFDAKGVSRVVLSDSRAQVAAIYANGSSVVVVPRNVAGDAEDSGDALGDQGVSPESQR